MLDAGELVLELDPPEVAVDRGLEGRAAGGHAAVVERPHEEAAARQQVLEGGGGRPRVRDRLAVRAAVDADDDGIALLRVEGGGLEERRVERRAVLRLDLGPLGRAALEAEDGRAGVLLDHEALRAVLAGEPHLRRGPGVGPRVRVEAAVGGDDGAVGAVLPGEAGAAGAVEADPVEVPLARVLLGRGEVEEAAPLVEDEAGPGAAEGDPAVHHPGPVGHGAAAAGHVAEVEVGEAVPLGEPEEAAPVLQEARRAEGVEPRPRALGEDRARGPERVAGGGGHRQQAEVQLVLGPVQVLEGHVPGVESPAELGQDVDVVRRERDEPLGPGCAVLLEADDAEPHDGVGGAGLRVALPLDLVADGQEVHDGEGRHARLVELQVRDRPRVGGPEERLPGARGELLLVDPVEPAVEQRVGAALGEARLAAGRDVHDPEVVLADEGDARPVGGGLGVLLRLGGRTRARTAAVRTSTVKTSPAAGTRRVWPSGSQDAVGEGQRPRLLAGHHRLRPVEEERGLALRRVDRVEARRLAGAAQEGEPLPVGVPLQPAGQRPGERGLRVDALDGELRERLGERRGRGRGGGRRGGSEARGREGHGRARSDRTAQRRQRSAVRAGPRTACR